MSDLIRYFAALGFQRQRGLIVCQCKREWAFNYLAQINADYDVCVLTSVTTAAAWRARGMAAYSAENLRTQLLGGEYDVLLIDVESGLSPDGLALTAGALRGGGVCIFLFEQEVDSWPQAACADYSRMLPYPKSPQDSSHRFLTHLKEVLFELVDSQQALLLTDSLCLPARAARKHSLSSVLHPIPVQQQAITLFSTHIGLGLLTGPRGAGKSVCLGLLAQCLLNAQREVVFLSVSSASRVVVQKVVGRPLPTEALEQLLMRPVITAADTSDCVLLIDEAAALPVAVIEQLCLRFPTVIMASTTEGYEGSGQALVVKLLQRWQQRADFVHIALEESLRFNAPDPVSQLLQRGLLLDAALPTTELSSANEAHTWRYVSQDELLADKALLANVYGLLRTAHYRTTPDDLRVLLDGADTHCAIVQVGSRIVAVCLFVIEGELDPAISDAIVAGQRRPRGHLLLQRLALKQQNPEVLQQRAARVMRIAVVESLRRRGLAQQCLQGVEAWLRARAITLIGSSFSASDEAMGFWLSQGYELVQIGQRRHPASGELSALVVKSLIESQ